MKLTRTGRLVRNLLLAAFCLFLSWLCTGMPLPLTLQYRRAERAHFLQPRKILAQWKQEGRVVSADANRLYLYSRDGYWVPDGAIAEYPLENGAAYGVYICRAGYTAMDVVAYEDSGQAVRAELYYAVTPENTAQPELVYQLQAEREDGLFHFPVKYQLLSQLESGSMAISGMETDYITDLYEHRFGGYRISSSYVLKITFYDEAGIVAEIHESDGEDQNEDR